MLSFTREVSFSVASSICLTGNPRLRFLYVMRCMQKDSGGFHFTDCLRRRRVGEDLHVCSSISAGCGRSEGEFDYGWREQEDARAAFELLLGKPGVNSERAFVVGRSLGGTVALHSLMRDSRAKGFALWATPPDHHRNVRNFITKRYGSIRYLLFFILSYIDRFHDVTGAMKIELFGLKLRLRDLRWKLMALNSAHLLSETEHPPILIVIGEEDEYVTLREAQGFENSISGKRRLVVFKTGHTFKGVEENMISVTLGWFEELLKSQPLDAQM